MTHENLRTLKILLRVGCALLASALAGLGVSGAIALARLPDSNRPASAFELAGVSAALLLFFVGFLIGVLRLARLAGSRPAQAAPLAIDVASLEQAALTDSLTGLRNHRAFHEDLSREISRRNRTGTPFSLLMIDLNGLKAVNDSLGHQAGDERIMAVADAIRATLRGHDTGYRVGGDEFMVILPAERAWGALNAANRLHAELELHANAAVAVGLAESTGTESKDTLVRRADLALYEAKRCRLGTVVFSPELEPQGDERVPDEAPRIQALVASALARVADTKRAGTRHHCERVGALSAMIGDELGLAPQRIRRLRLAGLLHDVGTIGIADSILEKPGPLSEDEWQIVRNHAGVGQSIVSAIELEEEARWVLQHHERFDGGGYPYGSSGDEIPLESRIIFVADAFEAMTSDRPYDRSRAPFEALEELVAHAGTQFDPACVAALCSVFQFDPSRAERVELEPARRTDPILKFPNASADR